MTVKDRKSLRRFSARLGAAALFGVICLTLGPLAKASEHKQRFIVVAEAVPMPRFNPRRAAADPIGDLIDGNGQSRQTSEIAEPPLSTVGFKLAIRALDQDDPAGATLAAYALPDRTSSRLIDWLVATGGYKSVPSDRIGEIRQRLENWPGQGLMQLRFEQALLREEPSAKTIVASLDGARVQTDKATIALTAALLETGSKSKARKLIAGFWRNSSFEQDIEKQIVASFADLLSKSDHKYRMDRQLYDGQATAALRTAKHLGKPQRDLATAVAAVITRQGKAAELLAKLPDSARNDPLSLFARIQIARRADRNREAADMLIAAPSDAKLLIDPDAWWVERRIVSRAMAEKGEAQLAYRIAAGHSARSNTRRAEAEFHAGWYALEYLSDPKTATGHFANITKIASRPLSLSRAHYWLARAAQAAGDDTGAQKNYRKAAAFPVTFYGQLALARLEVEQLPLTRAPSPDQDDRTRFGKRGFVQAARLLIDAKYTNRAAVFFRRLSTEIDDPAELRLLSDMATAAGLYQVALQIGILAVGKGHPVGDLAFPTTAIPAEAKIKGIEKAVVYAIARQESRFNREAISSAGARGLLQLMPATARDTARAVGLPYSKSRLITDPAYNATLGSAYLAEMVDRFGGSYVMTFAAYNAGGSRVDQWVERFGDPRDPKTDVVNWIEAIPFTETRNYVQRIMENLQVYRARFGDPGIAIESDLRRGSAN